MALGARIRNFTSDFAADRVPNSRASEPFGLWAGQSAGFGVPQYDEILLALCATYVVPSAGASE
jgi:hypothetical protein